MGEHRRVGLDSLVESLWTDRLELVPLLPPRSPTCVLESHAVAHRVVSLGHSRARGPPPSICERDDRPGRMVVLSMTSGMGK
jgi:hypothetical protein